MNDLQVQPGVFVNGDVAETDHLLHLGCEIGRQDAGGLQEGKCVAAFLRGSKAALVDHVQSEVNGGLASSLKI